MLSPNTIKEFLKQLHIKKDGVNKPDIKLIETQGRLMMI